MCVERCLQFGYRGIPYILQYKIQYDRVRLGVHLHVWVCLVYDFPLLGIVYIAMVTIYSEIIEPDSAIASIQLQFYVMGFILVFTDEHFIAISHQYWYFSHFSLSIHLCIQFSFQFVVIMLLKCNFTAYSLNFDKKNI